MLRKGDIVKWNIPTYDSFMWTGAHERRWLVLVSCYGERWDTFSPMHQIQIWEDFLREEIRDHWARSSGTCDNEEITWEIE